MPYNLQLTVPAAARNLRFPLWQMVRRHSSMALERYQPEAKLPHHARAGRQGGQARGRKGLAFVIQKHAASRLHYDFRLELNGVLLSWAVPKGPSLDPNDKRLAMHVEDHPLEYGEFEGVIPPKQYGAGTVMLWDRGHVDARRRIPTQAYAKGQLKFELHGEKLQGGWKLVRSRGSKYGGDKSWLLIKENDEFARLGPQAHDRRRPAGQRRHAAATSRRSRRRPTASGIRTSRWRPT